MPAIAVAPFTVENRDMSPFTAVRALSQASGLPSAPATARPPARLSPPSRPL